MMKEYMLAFASAVAFVALAVSESATASAQSAPGVAATPHHSTHRPTRSYQSEMRHRSNMSKERARAGAEHTRTMHMQ